MATSHVTNWRREARRGSGTGALDVHQHREPNAPRHCHHRARARHAAPTVHALRLESPETIINACTASWRPANRESPRLSAPRSTTSLSRSCRHITTKEGGSTDHILPHCAHTDVMRRTTLDREPKVANQHVDLLRLFKRVNDEGGYDKVSDTKNNKLAWRRLAADFLQDSSASQITTQAFLIKTAYYKNLACAFHHCYASRLLTSVSERTRYPRYISANHHQRRFSRTSQRREETC